MLSTVAEITSPDGQKWLLGADGQIHREVRGNLTAIIKSRDEFGAAWGVKPKDSHDDEVLYWNETKLPPPSLLRALHDSFFSQYRHEVICWWGIPRKKFVQLDKGKRKTKSPPVLFFVPTQTCSVGSVETVKSVAQQEMTCFSKIVRVMGDIHSHPGGGMPSRSPTDVNDMSLSSGFFGIFAQGTPKIRWYGGVCKALAELITLDLTKVKPARSCPLMTQGGRPVDEVVIEERIQMVGGSGVKYPEHWPHNTHQGSTPRQTTTSYGDYGPKRKRRRSTWNTPKTATSLTLAQELELFDGWTVRGGVDCHVWLVVDDKTAPTDEGLGLLREETIITVNPDEEERVAAILQNRGYKWVDMGPLQELVKDVWVDALFSTDIQGFQGFKKEGRVLV